MIININSLELNPNSIRKVPVNFFFTIVQGLSSMPETRGALGIDFRNNSLNKNLERFAHRHPHDSAYKGTSLLTRDKIPSTVAI